VFVIYEEDGDIKAGTILADNDASLQIESQHGKRAKIKAGHVLMRYPGPAPTPMMEEARRLAGEVDTDFLWEAPARMNSVSPIWRSTITARRRRRPSPGRFC
jgi:exoribonuclease-2